MTPFQKKVYAVVKKIPRRKVATYRAVAAATGNSRAVRAVGNALHKNRSPQVPCHRVICSDGLVGGYNRGTGQKVVQLKREGIEIKKGRVDLTRYQWKKT